MLTVLDKSTFDNNFIDIFKQILHRKIKYALSDIKIVTKLFKV